MNEEQFRNKVRRTCERVGSISKFCEKNGITRSHVSEFLSGVGPCPQALLDVFKFETQTVYFKRRT